MLVDGMEGFYVGYRMNWGVRFALCLFCASRHVNWSLVPRLRLWFLFVGNDMDGDLVFPGFLLRFLATSFHMDWGLVASGFELGLLCAGLDVNWDLISSFFHLGLLAASFHMDWGFVAAGFGLCLLFASIHNNWDLILAGFGFLRWFGRRDSGAILFRWRILFSWLFRIFLELSRNLNFAGYQFSFITWLFNNIGVTPQETTTRFAVCTWSPKLQETNDKNHSDTTRHA
mmetsp:Transcript_11952/g.18239  ORF Transcript_11952/g.18239 Transcript_11952/m.18239 type:complete len:229 (-) Transcript_11952:62-748(-)